MFELDNHFLLLLGKKLSSHLASRRNRSNSAKKNNLSYIYRMRTMTGPNRPNPVYKQRPARYPRPNFGSPPTHSSTNTVRTAHVPKNYGLGDHWCDTSHTAQNVGTDCARFGPTDFFSVGSVCACQPQKTTATRKGSGEERSEHHGGSLSTPHVPRSSDASINWRRNDPGAKVLADGTPFKCSRRHVTPEGALNLLPRVTCTYLSLGEHGFNPILITKLTMVRTQEKTLRVLKYLNW